MFAEPVLATTEHALVLLVVHLDSVKRVSGSDPDIILRVYQETMVPIRLSAAEYRAYLLGVEIHHCIAPLSHEYQVLVFPDTHLVDPVARLYRIRRVFEIRIAEPFPGKVEDG